MNVKYVGMLGHLIKKELLPNLRLVLIDLAEVDYGKEDFIIGKNMNKNQ
jgi:hypothetical protein